MDSVRASSALAYIDGNATKLENHLGAAYAEGVILDALVNKTPSGTLGILGQAYKTDLIRGGVLDVPDRATAYKLTHTIIFATDFGRQKLTGLSNYEALLEQLVVTYADDTDVLGELLISARCISYWSPAMDTAYQNFCSQWDAVNKQAGLFNQNYHVILVGGILFAMEE